MQESFPKFVIQAPFRQVLSNGLTLVHRPDFASPVVSLQLWVKPGSLHEGAYLGSGISHYIEHLVFKGTERRTGPHDQSGDSCPRGIHQCLYDF